MLEESSTAWEQRVKKHVPQKSLFEPVEQRGCGGRWMCVGFVQECKQTGEQRCRLEKNQKRSCDREEIICTEYVLQWGASEGFGGVKYQSICCRCER